MTSTSFERLVVIDGMPRSGTSWLAQIVESSPIVRYRLCPLFAHQFKGRIDESSGRRDWLTLLEDAYNADDAYMSREHERVDHRYPVFAERLARPPVLALKFDRFHDLMPDLLKFFADNDLRIVFLVRHPCGAIHSWLTAPREFPADADPLEHWRDGKIKKQARGDFFGFDDWKVVTRMQLGLERRYPRHVRIVRYESLAANPVRESRSVFDHLMLPYGKQTAAFIAASQATHHPDPYAVFKAPAVANRWRSELNSTIREEILQDLRGGELERFVGDEV